MSESLIVYYRDRRVGHLVTDSSDRLAFDYDETWLQASDAFPLSLSLPLRREVYEHPEPYAFFENLLPESRVRQAVERGFKLGSDSPYQFLHEFGDDLAGAFTILPDGTLPSDQAKDRVEVPWSYIDAAIENGQTLYQALSQEFGAKFSLAGAQDKFVGIYDEQRDVMALAKGDEPTHHIVKIDLDFRNSQTVYNEAFCLDLARRVGLKTVKAKVRNGRHPLLIVERYDRRAEASHTRRLHQEDLCQALGLPSRAKYEEKGGKPFAAFYAVIRGQSRQPIVDLESVLGWLVFNLVIGNNDAHGKNLSILYAPEGTVLAPFYDLLSTEVYEGRFDSRLAFGIGGVFTYTDLRPEHCKAEAKALSIRSEKLLHTFSAIALKVEEHLSAAVEELRQVAPAATIGARISDLVQKRLKHWRKIGGFAL